MTQSTLRSARREAGFTQQFMADELGVSRPTHIKIEGNPSKASVLQAKRICEILGKSYEQIFSGKSAS